MPPTTTWHAHINIKLEAFGFPLQARTDPAAHLQGAGPLACWRLVCGRLWWSRCTVQENEAGVWLRIEQGQPVTADVRLPVWRAAALLRWPWSRLEGPWAPWC